MASSVLYDAVAHDQYCITAVRGLSETEGLSRLGVVEQGPYPLYTLREALQGHGFGALAVRVCRSEGWLFLLDVDPQGITFQAPVLRRLSADTEAVSAWHLLDGTTRIAHARDGDVLATFDAWLFEPAGGTDPARLNRALEESGFFLEENEESDEWNIPEMALLAIEREFGLVLPPGLANEPLPTVSVPKTAV
ncbi:DUF6461 domain-containing protein [Streptomyces sparsogenes]|uniref:Uncharacterized protein n=1 Tax=Streptomyces sparsogenes DSM 40356 TaxID=1331668 RepID=A0A1R1SFK5_9ACTN|nr:DUF6461 domain-containing protein [Streptomyces sparsogenes]OMI37032.1 hypothetical protein SPAR_22999 [Streptomyces sparsogenes DSM 40356]